MHGGNEVIRHAGAERANEDIGEPREHLARLLGGNRSGQDTRPDQEHVLLAEQADRVEHFLVASRLRERTRELRFEPSFIGRHAEEPRVDQRIDDVRVLRQDIGEARGDAEDERDEANKVGFSPQQRQRNAPPARSPARNLIKGHKGAVGIFPAGELIDEDRDELGETGARLLSPHRAR